MSNETKPLLSDEAIRNDVALTVQATPNRTMQVKDLPLSAYQVRDIYEADRSKLMAVLQICADALEQERIGYGRINSDGDFVLTTSALSQLKAIGIEPNHPPHPAGDN